MWKKNRFRGMGMAIIILSVVLWGFSMIQQMNLSQKAEGAQILEQTIRRAALTCYANEGIYPPTLEYLVEHYGVQLQEERYQIFYEGFAENLMPEITVLEKKTP